MPLDTLCNFFQEQLAGDVRLTPMYKAMVSYLAPSHADTVPVERQSGRRWRVCPCLCTGLLKTFSFLAYGTCPDEPGWMLLDAYCRMHGLSVSGMLSAPWLDGLFDDAKLVCCLPGTTHYLVSPLFDLAFQQAVAQMAAVPFRDPSQPLLPPYESATGWRPVGNVGYYHLARQLVSLEGTVNCSGKVSGKTTQHLRQMSAQFALFKAAANALELQQQPPPPQTPPPQ
jgi:hypothetical protein